MEFFLPRVKVLVPHRQPRIEPLFPRYFFCLVGDAWRQLLTTIGISGVIMAGDKPALLKDDVVDELKARCDGEGVFLAPPPFHFRKGMKVRIKCGALAGLTGVVQGMCGKERISVLINAIGSSTVKANVFEGDLALLT
jgi:transcriptional antiterminator RfaH